MRASVRGPLTIVACAVLSACYQAHERRASLDDAQRVDGSVLADAPSGSDAWSMPDAWSGSDAWSEPDVAQWDGGTCAFVGGTWPGICTAERDAECLRRAMVLAPGRYGHARCVQIGRVGEVHESFCSLGDYCPDGPDPATCRCTRTRFCLPGTDVCVSDTIDGPTYCAPICTRP